jgi:hypothetical protein
MSEIIKDHVSLDVYERMNYATACEDCTHFDHETEKCTFGFPTAPHLKRNQLADLEKTGKIAFCRMMEID